MPKILLKCAAPHCHSCGAFRAIAVLGPGPLALGKFVFTKSYGIEPKPRLISTMLVVIGKEIRVYALLDLVRMRLCFLKTTKQQSGALRVVSHLSSQ